MSLLEFGVAIVAISMVLQTGQIHCQTQLNSTVNNATDNLITPKLHGLRTVNICDATFLALKTKSNRIFESNHLGRID